MAEEKQKQLKAQSDADAIYKESINKEIEGAIKWEKEWGFLIEKYKKLQRDSAKPKIFTIAEEDKKESSIDYPKYPETTAKVIGWLAGNPIYSLEKFGRYARPMGTIYKRFNWPIEGCP